MQTGREREPLHQKPRSRSQKNEDLQKRDGGLKFPAASEIRPGELRIADNRYAGEQGKADKVRHVALTEKPEPAPPLRNVRGRRYSAALCTQSFGISSRGTSGSVMPET